MTSEIHVVYIDDHPASRQVMLMLLKHVMGIANVTILDSTQDFENAVLLWKKPISIVLTDVNMQPLNGYEVCTILRADDSFTHIPIVGVTAGVNPQDMRYMKTAGFSGVITKPLSHTTFPDLFNRVLAGEVVWED